MCDLHDIERGTTTGESSYIFVGVGGKRRGKRFTINLVLNFMVTTLVYVDAEFL